MLKRERETRRRAAGDVGRSRADSGDSELEGASFRRIHTRASLSRSREMKVSEDLVHVLTVSRHAKPANKLRDSPQPSKPPSHFQ